MEQIKSPLAAKWAGIQGKTIVVHATPDWAARIRDRQIDFFTKLSSRLAEEGISMRLTNYSGATSKVLLSQDHFHLMVGAPAQYGPNVLHANPAYIWGFWYLDEVGRNWNSSLRFARFDPDTVDREKAEYFFNGVSGYMIRENVSRMPQETIDQDLEDAAAVIFCQEIDNDEDRSFFLDTEAMIRTVASEKRTDRVYVKLHPNQSKPMRLKIMEVCNDYPNVRIVTHSIHRLIEKSAVVVTQNSAAGFEALMQKKPVITCARSDFWHATLTPRSRRELAEAVQYASTAMKNFEYEKYFFWFLSKNCLEPQKENFSARAWSRIRNKAFL